MDEEFILIDEEGKEKLIIVDEIDIHGDKYILAKPENEDIFFILKEKEGKYIGIEDEEEYEMIKDICRGILDSREVSPEDEE